MALICYEQKNTEHRRGLRSMCKACHRFFCLTCSTSKWPELTRCIDCVRENIPVSKRKKGSRESALSEALKPVNLAVERDKATGTIGGKVMVNIENLERLIDEVNYVLNNTCSCCALPKKDATAELKKKEEKEKLNQILKLIKELKEDKQ